MAKGGRNLDAELDALYGAPMAAFTAARNELAKRLASEGLKDDAVRVKALKKPSAAAWAVNQLALGKGGALGALFAAAARMRKPADLKEALRERREALTAAARAAESALAASGHAANPDVKRRISATLEALAAHAGRADAPRAGRLTEDLQAPGFDEIASLGLLGGAPVKKAGETPPASHSKAPASRSREHPSSARPSFPSKEEITRAKAKARQDRRDAVRERARLRREEAAARARLAAAEKALAAARRRRSNLEGSLSKAVAEEERLAAEAAAARKALDAATSRGLSSPAAGP